MNSVVVVLALAASTAGLLSWRRRSPAAPALLLPAAVLLGAATVVVPGGATAVYSDVGGCTAGCDVATAGWPLPWAYDYPGASTPGYVDTAEILLGPDRFHVLPFLLSVALAGAILALAAYAVRRWAGLG